MSQRWTIIRDDSGHSYLCPANRADEAQATLDAIERYWAEATYDGDPPAEPDGLVRLEGGRLTFEAPLVDGQAP